MLLPELQKGLLLPLATASSKIPFLEVYSGEAIDEEKESQIWAGRLGIRYLEGVGPGIT